MNDNQAMFIHALIYVLTRTLNDDLSYQNDKICQQKSVESWSVKLNTFLGDWSPITGSLIIITGVDMDKTGAIKWNIEVIVTCTLTWFSISKLWTVYGHEGKGT